MYRDNKETAIITYEDAEWLSKRIGESLYKWITEHPKTNAEVCSDLVLASLEGYISGTASRVQDDIEEEEDDRDPWSQQDTIMRNEGEINPDR